MRTIHSLKVKRITAGDCARAFEDNDLIMVKMPGNAVSKVPDEVSSNNDNVPVMPEFPSFLILPLFMMTTLLAIIVYRRKHSM